MKYFLSFDFGNHSSGEVIIDLLLVAVLSTLGFNKDIVLDVIAEPDPIKLSEKELEVFFFFKLLRFFSVIFIINFKRF